MSAVHSRQRFTKAHPCPVCGGHEQMPQGQGARCWGFLSDDGTYAHCTREEYRGDLRPGPDGAYAHRLSGPCTCGKVHREQTDGSGSTPVAIYRYGDFEKGRFEDQSGKTFAWRAIGVQGWPRGASGASMAAMPLYGFEEVAARPDDPCYFAEGEKAADSLRAHGLVAVTNAGGAKQRDFGQALELLAGRDVRLWPDNDDDGRGLMKHLAGLLRPKAKVSFVDWQAAPPKGDAVDFFRLGGTLPGIEAMIVQSSVDVEQPSRAPSLVEWSTFWSKDRRLEDWLAAPMLPRGRSIAMFSPPKTGKSLLALDIAARLATGQRLLDQPAGAAINVLYLDKEMTEDDLYERLEDMGYGPETDLSHLFYYLLPDLPPLDTPEGGDVLRQMASGHKADLVIIDTTSRVLAGPENDADTLRAYYINTGLPLKADGRTVWRLDHSGKDLTRGQRGTSAKNDDVDLVWEMTAREDGGIRLKATHRRQSWIPEIIDLVRLEEPLRHERAAESWPAGTVELAARLDALEVPLDYGRRRVRPVLKSNEIPARNEAIDAAIRYRNRPGHTPGHTPQGDPGTRDGLMPAPRYGDTPRDTPGHTPAAVGVVPPSLDGDTPPDPCPICGETLRSGLICHPRCVPEYERMQREAKAASR